MRWSTILLSMAALAVFEGIVSRTAAAGRVGGVLAQAGNAVHWFVSPAVPFFKTTATPSTASKAPAQTATLL